MGWGEGEVDPKIAKDFEEGPKFWCDLRFEFLSSALPTLNSLGKIKFDALMQLSIQVL